MTIEAAGRGGRRACSKHLAAPRPAEGPGGAVRGFQPRSAWGAAPQIFFRRARRFPPAGKAALAAPLLMGPGEPKPAPETEAWDVTARRLVSPASMSGSYGGIPDTPARIEEESDVRG